MDARAAQDCSVMFSVNTETVTLGDSADLSTNLFEAIRTWTRFKSAKLGCGEGGCGACAVQLATMDVQTEEVTVCTVNSCLVPVGMVDGCAITTAEGLGNSDCGFHIIQEQFAAKFASQCGFCTPGMVVAAHATLARCTAQGATPTPQDFQKGLDGNLCRCTGYRPVLDACKGAAAMTDIEELARVKHGGAWGTFPASLRQYVLEKYGTSAPVPCSKSQGKRTWLAPRTLPELLAVMKEHGGQGLHLVGGNTASGVYKDWPPAATLLVSVGRVSEMRRREWQKGGGLLLGAAVTLAELLDALQSPQAQAAANPLAWQRVAAHVERIAGHHVRGAATVGGNLVLARCRALPSDLAPLLLALGARVQLASADGHRWLDLADFLDSSEPVELGVSEVLAAVEIPAPAAADCFWSHKVALRYYNSHALVNMAIYLMSNPACDVGDGEAAEDGAKTYTARIAVGCPLITSSGDESWSIRRLPATEAQLSNRSLDGGVMLRALQAIRTELAPQDGKDTERLEERLRIAEGMLFQGLAPFAAAAEGPNAPAELQRLLAHAGPDGAPAAPVTQQDMPGCGPELAPVGQSVEKDNIRLQASGEAMYSGDACVGEGELYAAVVWSSRALAKLEQVDYADALKLPGVVGVVTAADIPKGGSSEVYGIPLFAGDKVEWVGQPLGLVVASSQSIAQQAVKLVKVQYSELPDAKPIITMEEAIAAGSFYDDPALQQMGQRHVGDARAALADAPLTLSGRHSLPSQQHFYMEPQTSVACPGEGGSMTLHSATQGLDAIQRAVSEVLNIPYHQVTVVCARVGGGFGGKSSRAMPVAAAAALAARKMRRKVHYALTRNDDFRQNAGRCTADFEYDVGFNSDGVLSALRVRAWMRAGAYMDLANNDMGCLVAGSNCAYALPNLDVEVKLCRCNLPPHTIVRGPGFIQIVMVMEQVMEHVAAHLNLDPAVVKQRNFAPAPAIPRGMPPPDHTHQHQAAAAPCTSPLAVRLGEAYTLPRLWEQLLGSSEYGARLEAVAKFNKEHAWRKRGIAITPAKFDCAPPPMTAALSVYSDGSVLLHSGGLEMGQGLATKIKQTAAFVLGQVLPEAQRPLPLDLIRVAPASSAVCPNGAQTWSSTGSEAAVAAVAQAARTLVHTLAPLLQDKGEATASWKATVASVSPEPGILPASAMLSAYGFYDGTQATNIPLPGHKAGRGGSDSTALGPSSATSSLPTPESAIGQLMADVLAQCGEVVQQQLQDVLHVLCSSVSRGHTCPDMVNKACEVLQWHPQLRERLRAIAGAPSMEPTAVKALADALGDARPAFAPPRCVAAAAAPCPTAAAAASSSSPSSAPRQDHTSAGVVHSLKPSARRVPGTCPKVGRETLRWVRKSSDPVAYSTYAAAVTEVELNMLTGERTVLRCDLLFDGGRSINPSLDLGQIEGGFVMGMGMMLSETVDVDPASGKLLSDSTWEYKVPTAACIPRTFNVTFLKDSPNLVGMLGSKASGEPPLLVSTSTALAFQSAVAAAYKELQRPADQSVNEGAAGEEFGHFLPVPAPATPQQLRRSCGAYWAADVLQAALGDRALVDVAPQTTHVEEAEWVLL